MTLVNILFTREVSLKNVNIWFADSSGQFTLHFGSPIGFRLHSVRPHDGFVMAHDHTQLQFYQGVFLVIV